MCFLLGPRVTYYRDFMYWPQKLFLLRGGRACKVEANNPGNTRYIYWIENRFCKPLTQDRLHFDDRDEAEFLNEEGQLPHKLWVELDEFKVWGVNTNVGVGVCRTNNWSSPSTGRCTSRNCSRPR